MKRLVLTVLLLISFFHLHAQEINFGIHLNPNMTTPVNTRNYFSTDTTVKFPFLDNRNVGWNVGASLKYSMHKWAVRGQFGFLVRTYTNRIGGEHLTQSISSLEYSFELWRQLAEHDKKQKYKVYLLGGGAYETGYYFGYGIGGNGDINFKTDFFNNLSSSCRFYHLVAGANINTVIHHFGMIDYGLVFHFPVNSDPQPVMIYSVSHFESGVSSFVKIAEFHPALAYMDFRICYYILSLDRKFQRIKYKKL